jgi:predicted dehydrogenase
VDDYFDVTLYYPNLRVKLKSSYLVREALPGFILHGSKGSFLKSRADIQEAALQADAEVTDEEWGEEPESERGLLHTEINGKTVRERIPTLKGNYYEYYDAMYNAMVHHQPVPVSAEDAILVIRLIQAALQSNQEKKVLSF